MKQVYRTDSASLNASVNGAGFKVERLIGASFQFKWTDSGALDGTLKLQASNDAFVDNPTAPENPNATWNDIDNSSITVSGSSSDVIDLLDTQVQALRWVWTRVAGAGSLTVVISSKGRN